jgi:hypothetical protein
MEKTYTLSTLAIDKDMLEILLVDSPNEDMEYFQRDFVRKFLTVHLENARLESIGDYKYPVLDLVYLVYIKNDDGMVSTKEVRSYLMPFREHHLQICGHPDGEWDLGSSIPIDFGTIDRDVLAVIASELISEFARTNLRTIPYKLSKYGISDIKIDQNTHPDQYEFHKFLCLMKENGF